MLRSTLMMMAALLGMLQMWRSTPMMMAATVSAESTPSPRAEAMTIIAINAGGYTKLDENGLVYEQDRCAADLAHTYVRRVTYSR